MGLRRRSGDDASSADATAAAAATKKKAGRAARKAAAATGSTGADLARHTRQPLTASRAKRLIGVSKVVAPLLAPYALAAAGVLRARWDAYRAARLGVDPSQLSAYAGPGGALHARLSRVAEALNELESRAGAGAADAARTFAVETRPRLVDLAVAVRAAEQMPTARRRTAYRAIGGELGRIETDLLTHLGIST
ncbi:DUF6474 family protein [Pseudonocardia sp.]|jgi:hypothetical protein|uniref:DUF6474 family protein n=1 Tax=Pseudonocardia sp. TaxID=60912 RepID=UPI0031FD94DA